MELRASARDQTIVYVLLGTGMRVSELADLEMSQLVMAARKAIVLLRNEKGHGQRLRKLNVIGTAKRKLGQYLIERGNRPGLVFIGERGPLTPNAIQRIVRKYCGFAKVTASPSILRHTLRRPTWQMVEISLHWPTFLATRVWRRHDSISA